MRALVVGPVVLENPSNGFGGAGCIALAGGSGSSRQRFGGFSHPRLEPDDEGWAQRRVAFGMNFGQQRRGAGLRYVSRRVADFEPCDKPPGDIGQHYSRFEIDASAADERLQPYCGFAQIAARLARRKHHAADERYGERLGSHTGGNGADDQARGWATDLGKTVGDALPGVSRQGRKTVEAGFIERPPQQRCGVGPGLREVQQLLLHGSPGRIEIENTAGCRRISGRRRLVEQ
jgi:hypothetical protein